ncbi:LLM class flavin-dependent oxidoreductase [Pseudohalioglobus lutimaris]|uniref:LLM class flavin-dependent oxidoreductase n=1 Tax=Pseudohalioglobus lutimaris TaxID=1737061 RepID=A0A2N5X314_9GAMM|nr:LLM class flavin-dependent oxidoreductase [Pseudohalioglobus lutimaris]PLW68869.1 LLM class flavin-dependent oxidoreductase [Pseudohalioglobus lutimaris]
MTHLSVLQFDLRRAPSCPDTPADRTRACLEMVRWADAQGISVAGFSEHHNTSDGFLSAPLMLAMASAACTQRIVLSVSALQLPLHDPLRVAEDIVALDQVSRGRFNLTVGLGYRQCEYQAFGADWQRRGKVFDEKLAILLRALSGEAFAHRGVEVQLTPSLHTPARSIVFVGGNSVAAANRAARFGLYFAPAIDDPALGDAYQAACKGHGFEEGFVIYPREPCLTLIAEDPDKAWKELGEFLLYDAQAYASWAHPSRRAYAESAASTLPALRQEGKYAILSPEQAASRIVEKGSINLSPLCGGIPIDAAWESLQLYSEQVIPRLQAKD